MTDQRPGIKTRRTTLADVAQLTGVSVGTVSKALNDRDGISQDTRDAVLAAAEKLSFRPNSLARGLLSGRTNTVGLLTNDLEGRFSLPMLMGAEDAFGAQQLSVFLCDARGDAIREQHYVGSLLDRQVDGILVVADRANPRPPLTGRIPVPVVYAYGPSSDPDDVSVITDDVEGGRHGAMHLMDIGRRRLVYIGGDPTYLASSQRADGALEALRSRGLSPVVEPAFGSWTEAWGRQATLMMLDRAPDLDGIMCGSDQIARGALDVLREQGRSVPGDIAVIGYDNWRPLAEQSRPQLSTVDMNFEELGRTAARLLFRRLAGEHVEGLHVVTPSLVTRSSTVS